MQLYVYIASPHVATPVLDHVGVNLWKEPTVVMRCETVLLNETTMNTDAVVAVLNSVIQRDGFRVVLAHCHCIKPEDIRHPSAATAKGSPIV